MKREKFLKDIEEILEKEISSLEQEIEIDSIGIMSLISYIDENFNKTIKMDDFQNVKTLNDLIIIIGENNFE